MKRIIFEVKNQHIHSLFFEPALKESFSEIKSSLIWNERFYKGEIFLKTDCDMLTRAHPDHWDKFWAKYNFLWSNSLCSLHHFFGLYNWVTQKILSARNLLWFCPVNLFDFGKDLNWGVPLWELRIILDTLYNTYSECPMKFSIHYAEHKYIYRSRDQKEPHD